MTKLDLVTPEEITEIRALMSTPPPEPTCARGCTHANCEFVQTIERQVHAELERAGVLLPRLLATIEHAWAQEQQTSAVLDGFVGDLQRAENAQVPTELFCPKCNTLHVDEGEWATTRLHAKHLCLACGHIWKPYPVTTTGVDFHVACHKRRDELLAQIARLSQTVPLESEVVTALEQRGVLLAEIGTLRAEISELKENREAQLRIAEAAITNVQRERAEVWHAFERCRGALIAIADGADAPADLARATVASIDAESE